MARQPAEDERLLLPAGSVTRGTRVFLKELSDYLHHPIGQLRRMAKRRGILKSSTIRLPDRRVEWVTEQGALRLITWARAKQGHAYHSGHKFHEEATRIAAAMFHVQQRNRAKRKAERAALKVQAALALAIPPAGTEDDSRGVCEAGGIGIAETPAVSTSESARIVVMDDAGRGMLALLGRFG